MACLSARGSLSKASMLAVSPKGAITRPFAPEAELHAGSVSTGIAFRRFSHSRLRRFMSIPGDDPEPERQAAEYSRPAHYILGELNPQLGRLQTAVGHRIGR